MEINDLMEKATRFHGHICPGLAIGVLAAKYILENGFKYSPNEEIVAVVENDNCSVDALQALLGTTYGKGNFIHQDYGKLNYSFYNRDSAALRWIGAGTLSLGSVPLVFSIGRHNWAPVLKAEEIKDEYNEKLLESVK